MSSGKLIEILEAENIQRWVPILGRSGMEIARLARPALMRAGLLLGVAPRPIWRAVQARWPDPQGGKRLMARKEHAMISTKGSNHMYIEKIAETRHLWPGSLRSGQGRCVFGRIVMGVEKVEKVRGCVLVGRKGRLARGFVSPWSMGATSMSSLTPSAQAEPSRAYSGNPDIYDHLTWLGKTTEENKMRDPERHADTLLKEMAADDSGMDCGISAHFGMSVDPPKGRLPPCTRLIGCPCKSHAHFRQV